MEDLTDLKVFINNSGIITAVRPITEEAREWLKDNHPLEQHILLMDFHPLAVVCSGWNLRTN